MRCAAIWLAALLSGSSCAVESGGLGEVDGAVRDAGIDARSIDAPGIDAGGIDARAGDSGTTADAAPRDAGPSDAGPPDAGPPPDTGPPDCRSMPESCGTPGGYGAGCTAPEECWPGLECCTARECGGDDTIGGTCTVSCGSCPLDMICQHGWCFFPCVSTACPHPDQVCQHGGTVCEWG